MEDRPRFDGIYIDIDDFDRRESRRHVLAGEAGQGVDSPIAGLPRGGGGGGDIYIYIYIYIYMYI